MNTTETPLSPGTEPQVTIVLPECSDDFVSDAMRYLTAMIEMHLRTSSGFGLGGEHGYGMNFENDVFAMHSYCWCEKDDCRWCGHDAPNFIHKSTGAMVHWYKYIGRGMLVSSADWLAILNECVASIQNTPRASE